jgi:hypothetical protein
MDFPATEFGAVLREIVTTLELSPARIVASDVDASPPAYYAWMKGAKPRIERIFELDTRVEKLWQEKFGADTPPRPDLLDAAAHSFPAYESQLRAGRDAAPARDNATREPDWSVLEPLREAARAIERELHKPVGDFFWIVFLHTLNESLRPVRSYAQSPEIEISTPMLYQAIVKQLAMCDSVDIVDQDVLRWTELVDPADGISFNTFNYSKTILDLTIDHAMNRPDYRVRRVFVVPPEHLKDASCGDKDQERLRRSVIEILTELERQIDENGVGRQLQNRVWVVPERPATAAALKLALKSEVKDAVIMHRNGQAVVMQEDITWLERKGTLDTKSRISARPGLVKACESEFEKLFDKAVEVRAFLETIPREDTE